jgi:hypothetical protein
MSAAVGAAAVAATFALPGVSYAAGPGNGNVSGIGNVLTGSGNTVSAPVSTPTDVCGIALASAGFASAGCRGGASSTVIGTGSGGNGNVSGIGNVLTGSGNTVCAPVSTPTDVCGIALAYAGVANAGCRGGARTVTIGG